MKLQSLLDAKKRTSGEENLSSPPVIISETPEQKIISQIRSLHLRAEQYRGELLNIAQEKFQKTLDVWMQIGEILSSQKQTLGHGRYTEWILENESVLGFGDRQARKYVQVFKKRDQIGEESKRNSEFRFASIDGLTKALSEPKQDQDSSNETEEEKEIQNDEILSSDLSSLKKIISKTIDSSLKADLEKLHKKHSKRLN